MSLDFRPKNNQDYLAVYGLIEILGSEDAEIIMMQYYNHSEIWTLPGWDCYKGKTTKQSLEFFFKRIGAYIDVRELIATSIEKFQKEELYFYFYRAHHLGGFKPFKNIIYRIKSIPIKQVARLATMNMLPKIDQEIMFQIYPQIIDDILLEQCKKPI